MKTKILHLFVLLALLIGLLAVTPAAPAHASTLTVDTLTDEADGSCIDGDCSLRDAVAAAINNDTITFSVNGTLTLTLGQISINKDITIQGPGANKMTVSGNDASRVFRVGFPATVTISGLTISHGYVVDDQGGGVLVYNANLYLDQVVVSDSVADAASGYPRGGGVGADSSAFLSITNSSILNNKTNWAGGGVSTMNNSSLVMKNVLVDNNDLVGPNANSGGGISIENHGPTLTLENLTVTNNTSVSDGGGLYIDSPGTISRSVFAQNTAVNLGGGIDNGSSLTVSESFFSGNSGEYGAGIYTASGKLTVSNTTFLNNTSASGFGGGIASGGELIVTNSTFSGNSAPTGGGIHSAGGPATVNNSTFSGNSAANGDGAGLYFNGGNFSLNNTILANSTTGMDCTRAAGSMASAMNNLIENNSAGPNDCGTPTSTSDPQLDTLSGNGGFAPTFALLSGSPAIDAGDNPTCELTDSRGVDRPQDGNSDLTNNCDMGAYEKLPPIVTPTFADVPLNYWAWRYIEGLYLSGITGGCTASPLNFCPSVTITRDQMAVFLLRGIRGSAYTPPPATGTVFADVPADFWAAAWIEQLYAEGITGGCGSGNYCPSTPVTRDQMAVFLLRAEHGSSYAPPAATGTVFGDIPADFWAAAWIEQLSAEGITGGCGSGNYCPSTPVTRDQMAVFLQRTFDLVLP